MPTQLLPTDLAGKVVVVTGASAGIGRAIAETFGACGAKVVLVGRDLDRLAQAAEQVSAAGGTGHPAVLDLAAEDAAEDLVAASLARYGRIDVIVHNAGIFDFQPFEQTPAASLDRQWATNLRMPYKLTQAALPHLGKGSAVVFVGSNAAQIGIPNTAAYTATKGAVEAMARALAVELAPRGIRVNTVSPGMTRTQMTSRLDTDPELNRAALAATPAGFIGDPQDVANAVVYLASDASRYSVGATLLVDGGNAVA
jgi:NAD(P)-dependent dehydrogenase (short-subunit alcohol dehydrogenase family)